MILQYYEYAGFLYNIVIQEDGRLVADPIPGQHSAASKDKHRRAALEQYLSDYGNRTNK